MIKCVALVCATGLAGAAGFAAPADENDEAAPSEDCGVASNCGGLGGWRVILLATEPTGSDPSDSEPVEDPVEEIQNRAPDRVGSIDDRALTVGGESVTVDVASSFSDPDGDDLTYDASSSNARVATATVSGSVATVAPVAEGTATITVTATDPDGLAAQQTFDAVVSPEEKAADLVVESPAVDDAAPDPGGSITFTATVRNRGDGESGATTLRYYRSLNSTISSSDTQVGTDPVATLRPGRSSNESISLSAPSSAGTYYYGACVDAVSGESSTTNNCSDSVEVDVSDGGTDDSYCRDGDTLQTGERCDLHGTTFYFEVESSGRSCLRAGGVVSCQGNSISIRNWSINGIRVTLVASRNDDDSWTIDDVDPEP